MEGTMGRLLAVVGCALLFAGGCEPYGQRSQFPAPPASPSLLPTPRPGWFAEPFRAIAVGDLVEGVVSRDDPPCTNWPQWLCQHFRITVPTDGQLDIVKTNARGNLDLSFEDVEGLQLWYPISTAVKAGATYQITIWEYEFPGVEFELRSSLRPH
jgi:hypothetical protein